MNTDLMDTLRSGGYSLVARQGGRIYTFRQRGVADLFDLYTGRPALLAGADVADKVVGRGAAALMVLAGVRSLHAGVASAAAMVLLHRAGVAAECEVEVPHIINRQGTGPCPLEAATEGLERPADMWPVIRDFVARLRLGGGARPLAPDGPITSDTTTPN